MRQSLSGRSRSWRLLLKETSAFTVVGGATFFLEIGLYQFAYTTLTFGPLWSKVLSTAVTAVVAYLLHRYWSFSHRERPGMRRELPLFAILNLTGLAISLLIIATARYGLGLANVYQLQVANVISIGVATVFRFLAYKKWVFPATSSAG